MPARCGPLGTRLNKSAPNSPANNGVAPLSRPVTAELMCSSASGNNVNGIATHTTERAITRRQSARSMRLRARGMIAERGGAESDPRPRDEAGVEVVEPDGDEQERRAPDHPDGDEQAPVEESERLAVGPRDDGRGRGSARRGRSLVNRVADASERAPASERPPAACVAGERHDGHGGRCQRNGPAHSVRHALPTLIRPGWRPVRGRGRPTPPPPRRVPTPRRWRRRVRPCRRACSRKRFRDTPMSTGRPSATSASRSLQQRPVVRRRLGETDPWVNDDPLDLHARRHGRLDSCRQLGHDVGDDVAVVGEVVHHRRRPAPVHGDIGHAESGDRGQHRVVAESAGDVVDEHRAGDHAVLRHRRPHCVDADRDTRTCERGDDVEDAAQLLVLGDRVAPGRVDSPPTSTMSAPAAASANPRSIAASRSSQRPPSLNESGVTLSTPITTGRRRPRRGAGRPAGSGVELVADHRDETHARTGAAAEVVRQRLALAGPDARDLPFPRFAA